MYFKYIVIRREFRMNEYRVPLVPKDCNKLIKNNIIIYVEKNYKRCYSDDEYIDSGCILIDNYIDLQHNIDDMLIVGLKELDYNLDYHFKYNHLYFSHTFKNQLNSINILSKFKQYDGSIYDLEYFTENNNRLFAFGFHAGIAGCYLGLLQYYYKKQLKDINLVIPFNSYEKLFNNIYNEYKSIYIQPNIAIIGNGRCTRGIIYLLDRLSLSYTIYTKNMNKDNLYHHDIIINCILLTDSIDPFITYKTLKLFKNQHVIVDISCDYTNINNPIPIYSTGSTFDNPIIKINDNVDLIAIDNLPSLLPKDSSYVFSSKLVDLFINKNNIIWDNNISIYQDKIKYLSEQT